MLRNTPLQKESSWFRHVGTSPFEAWYPCGAVAAPTKNTFVTTFDNIYAVPFYSGRGGTVDRIAFEVTTLAASSTGRVGLYTSDEDGYPKTLIVDGGEFATSTTGVKSATISQALPQNALLWAVALFGTASPTVRGFVYSSATAFLGYPSTIGTDRRVMLSGSQAYGALPSTFTSGCTPLIDDAIGIWLRYSA